MALLLLLVHLAAQAKRLLQQVVHLPQTVSVLLATLALTVMLVLLVSTSLLQELALVLTVLLELTDQGLGR